MDELFGVWNVSNAELKAVADFANECAVNTLKEPSAGLAIGLNEHAISRQRLMVASIRKQATALADRPYPDHPVTFAVKLACDYSPAPTTVMADGKPVNSHTVALATMWQRIAAELCTSNSGALGGSLLFADAQRIQANIDSLEQFLDAIPDMGSDEAVDFPATAEPQATDTGARIKRGR